jgi:raffinose/stachyose/melibiose transport system substrate-binding protein
MARKLGRVGLLVAAVALLLAGPSCRPARSPSATPTPTTRPEGQKTTVRFWGIWTVEPRKSTLQEIVRRFEAAHPDIHVEVNLIEPDAYKTAIRPAIGGTNPPDVFFVWSGEWHHNFIRGGKVMDLTDELAKDGWGQSLEPLGLRFFEYRGRMWGVPMFMQVKYMLYNTDIFSRLGLQVPSTWDELLSVCERIKQAGITPIALGNDLKWPAHHFATIMFQKLVGEKQVLADYDPQTGGAYEDPGYVEALRRLKLLVDRGYFNDHPNGVTLDRARALFYMEKAAMYYTGTWDFKRLEGEDGGEAPKGFGAKWSFFQFPAIPGGKGNQGYMMGASDGYAVAANTKAPEAALTWLRYFTSLESAKLLAKNCQELVQVKGAVTPETAGPKLLRVQADLRAAPGVTPWTDVMMERTVAEVFMNEVQALLDGKATPERVMERTRQQHQKVKRELAAGQR